MISLDNQAQLMPILVDTITICNVVLNLEFNIINKMLPMFTPCLNYHTQKWCCLFLY